MVEAECLEALETLVARGRRQHRRPGTLGHLDRGDPHAAGAGVDEHGLAGLEPAELEEAVVGGAEGDRNGGSDLGGEALGDLPAERLARHPLLGMRAVGRGAHDAISDDEARDTVADLEDGPSRLVAHDVRHRGELTSEAVERVTALDADGLHSDANLSRPRDGVGDLLEDEDLGSAVVVVHRCLHRIRLRSRTARWRPI